MPLTLSTTKGESAEAPVGAFHRLTTKMRWKGGVDLDLAVFSIKKDGTPNIWYFGNIPPKKDEQGSQSLDVFPFILLSGDAGVGGAVAEGGNEEEMIIADLSPYAKLAIVVWDYDAVMSGEGANFHTAGVTLSITDETGKAYDVTLSLADGGLAPKNNICVVATIDNTGPEPKLVNSSYADRFGGDSNKTLKLEHLQAFVEAAA